MRAWGVVTASVLVVVALAGNILYTRALTQAHAQVRAVADQFLLPAHQAPLTREPVTHAPDAQVAPMSPVAPPVEPTVAVPAPPTDRALPAMSTAATTTRGQVATLPSPIAAVRAKYAPRIQSIQADCEKQLDNLVQAGLTEYVTQRQTGQVDLADLAAKYLPRAQTLHQQCDGRVNTVLDEMSGDLRASGLSQDLVTQIRSAYEQRVADVEAELMAKAEQR